MTTERFFIRDCNGQIVGNPKGYRTMRGANAQKENHKSKAYKQIWAAYDAAYSGKEWDKGTSRHICSIYPESI